jgi:hypothetical protein
VLKHRHLWEAAGGIFIRRRNVDETLHALAEYFPIQVEVVPA